jgi:hypothetical protein
VTISEIAVPVDTKAIEAENKGDLAGQYVTDASARGNLVTYPTSTPSSTGRSFNAAAALALDDHEKIVALHALVSVRQPPDREEDPI